MIDQKAVIEFVKNNKIIVIMRGFDIDRTLKAAEAMYDGGIRLIEVTFDQGGKIPHSETAAKIKALCERFNGRMLIGAGTVMTKEQVKLAYDSGASYIISPDTCEEIIRYTKELGMVSMPGAFTPTECAMAHRYGADFVKLFPNSEVNVSYLKNLVAPLSHIRFLAVGGVNAENMQSYLDAGAVGVGVASGIANKTYINEGNFAKITELAKDYTKRIC